MTKHGRKDERREQILEAAIASFARKGYHRTTMDDIAAECGLSKGSLYWHYKNKKDLLLSIMTWYFEQLEQDLQAVMQSTPTAIGKLEQLADVFVHILSSTEMETLVKVFIDFYAETRHDEAVNATMLTTLRTFIKFLQTIVVEGIASGEFKAIDAHQLAIIVMAAYDGLYVYRMMLGAEVDWQQAGQLLKDTLLNGLKA